MSRLPLHPDLHAFARERAHALRREAIDDLLRRLHAAARRAIHRLHRTPEAAPCRS